jgi:hypothetical protein
MKRCALVVQLDPNPASTALADGRAKRPKQGLDVRPADVGARWPGEDLLKNGALLSVHPSMISEYDTQSSRE